jgi:hypothetical protein
MTKIGGRKQIISGNKGVFDGFDVPRKRMRFAKTPPLLLKSDFMSD